MERAALNPEDYSNYWLIRDILFLGEVLERVVARHPWMTWSIKIYFNLALNQIEFESEILLTDELDCEKYRMSTTL